MTPWPCRCGAPGVRNLGTTGYCADHLGALYATFQPEAFALHGVGLPVGADSHQLACVACAATWWGLAGEGCTWCSNRLVMLAEHQAELVLTPPAVDPEDITYDRQLAGWTQRVWVAVQAGLVDDLTARRTIEREVRRGARQPVHEAATRPRFRAPGAQRADHRRLVRGA